MDVPGAHAATEGGWIVKYTIINPSDPYTLEADDLQVAALVVSLLGEGKYALDAEDGGPGVPLLMLRDPDEWFVAQFGTTLGETMHAADPDALAACFESVTLQAAERSSMNDIGGRATAYATMLRRATAASAANSEASE